MKNLVDHVSFLSMLARVSSLGLLDESVMAAIEELPDAREPTIAGLANVLRRHSVITTRTLVEVVRSFARANNAPDLAALATAIEIGES